MKLRVFIAILAGKLARTFCRLLRKGGTAAPGRLALKIYPELLSILAKDVTCIVVTGTNGKTTCTRIVEQGLIDAGLSCFSNRSGANLIEGIATDFIVNSTLSGRCRRQYAVLECDEAASKNVCRQLQPDVIFVTNLFRDQVDRFGGVKNTRDDIRTGIKNAPGAVLCLNADCPVVASLADGVPNRAMFFGMGRKAAETCGGTGVSDLEGCIDCGGKYEYDYVTFSHLGAYRCTKCGRARPHPDYEVSEILRRDADGTLIEASVPEGRREIYVNLPAAYNIYNGIGSFAALRLAGVPAEAAEKAVGEFSCCFGRMERFDLGEKGARMILIKNDAGCNQVLEYLKTVNEPFTLAIYLNNNVSDGVDISWLEHAQFEILNSCPAEKIYVSGMRMEEMYARLVSAGIDTGRIIKESSCEALITALRKSENRVFIMPTYTGMMETRSEIVRQCGGAQYWEE